MAQELEDLRAQADKNCALEASLKAERDSLKVERDSLKAQLAASIQPSDLQPITQKLADSVAANS